MHRRCAKVLRVDTYLGVGACIRCLGNTSLVNNNIVVIDVDRAKGHLSKLIKLLICPRYCVQFVVYIYSVVHICIYWLCTN